MAGLHSFLLLLTICVMSPFVASTDDHDDHEHGCIRLDAALRYHHVDYLFAGFDYIELDANRVEVKIESKEDGWGNLPRIDAALIWAKDGYPYFFEGANYYYYSAWRANTYGPYPNTDWSEKLALDQGVDAASTAGPLSYFFKNCFFRVYNNTDETYSDQISLEGLGVACDLDAAFPLSDDSLAVVKFDKLWTLYNNGTATGPTDANEVLHLKSTELCSETEDEGESFLHEHE